MTRSFYAALVTCLFASTTPALAHAPLMGIGGVFGGIIHAVLVPEHGLTLLALGLWMRPTHDFAAAGPERSRSYRSHQSLIQCRC
jgi:hypothetical protein